MFCNFFKGSRNFAKFSLQSIEGSSCFNIDYFFTNKTKISKRCLKFQKDTYDGKPSRTIQSKTNEQIGFKVFWTTQFVFSTLFVTLNPADTTDWIDIVISRSHLRDKVDHPFDNIYVSEKLELTERKLTLKNPPRIRTRKPKGILFYLSTFNTSYGRIQLDIHVEKDPCCQFSFFKLFQTSYIWKKNVYLSKDDPGYLVTLPDFELGAKTILSTQPYDANTTSVSILKVYWLHDIYQHWIVIGEDSAFCPILTLLCVKYGPTINYIEKKVVATHHYVYLEAFSLFSGNRSLKITWNQASKLCQDMNGTLPILRSKEQQDEIISLLSSHQTPPPIMVLFIGLTFSNQSKMVR